MKKILSTALIAVVLSTMIVDTISAARSNMPAQRRNVKRGRGGRRSNVPARMRANSKKVQIVLETARQTDNPVVKQEAIRTANQLAKELLAEVQDRTWAGDVLGKYTEEQVAAAGAKYAALEVQKNQLMRDIDSKQAELDAMTVKGYIWSSVEGGKEAAHKVASQELAELKSTLRDVNKAMRDQAVIAGKEYCNSIRMAIGAITAVGIVGGVALIDQVATGGEYRKAAVKRAGKMYNEMELGLKPEETQLGRVQRLGGAALSWAQGGFSDIGTWAQTQYNRLPDVPGLGAKARKERADAAAKIGKADTTGKQLEAAKDKLDSTTPGTPENNNAQKQVDNLDPKLEKETKEAEIAVDKVETTVAQTEGQ